MSLHEIVYVSVACNNPGAPELSALLTQSRRNNAATDITGMLVYHDGKFLQLIEGEEAAVSALYQTIVQDPRHQQVNKVWDAALKARSFADWSMAFACAQPLATLPAEGFALLNTQELFAHSHDATGKKLLLSLRDHLLRSA